MEAIRQLERVQDGIGGLAKIMGMPEAIAILRDYITTTEAERSASEELEPGDPIASGCCPSCGIHIDVLAGEDENEVVAVGTNDAGFSRESYWIDHGEPPAKAARIKELEEALRHIGELTEEHAGGPWTKDIHAAAKAALSGARKVEPEGLKGER